VVLGIYSPAYVLHNKAKQKNRSKKMSENIKDLAKTVNDKYYELATQFNSVDKALKEANNVIEVIYKTTGDIIKKTVEIKETVKENKGVKK
jgi:methyl-accepting chemotaxis protein